MVQWDSSRFGKLRVMCQLQWFRRLHQEALAARRAATGRPPVSPSTRPGSGRAPEHRAAPVPCVCVSRPCRSPHPEGFASAAAAAAASEGSGQHFHGRPASGERWLPALTQIDRPTVGAAPAAAATRTFPDRPTQLVRGLHRFPGPSSDPDGSSSSQR